MGFQSLSFSEDESNYMEKREEGIGSQRQNQTHSDEHFVKRTQCSLIIYSNCTKTVFHRG
jgi:hypothetical protein